MVATGSILLLAPRWRDALLLRRWPRPLADAVAVPAAAQAACGPLVAMLASQVSLVAVPANLLVAPAVPAATVLGVLAAATEPLLPPLAGLLGSLAGVPAWWIVQVAQRGADVPSAAVSWPGGLVGGAALAVVTVAAIAVGRLVRRRRARHRSRRLATAGATALVVLVSSSWARRSAGGAWAGRRRGGSPSPATLVRETRSSWPLVRVLGSLSTPVLILAGGSMPAIWGSGPVPVLMRLTCMPTMSMVYEVLRGRSVGEVQVGPLPEPRAQTRRCCARPQRLALR